jgi:hypothetical protein
MSVSYFLSCAFCGEMIVQNYLPIFVHAQANDHTLLLQVG